MLYTKVILSKFVVPGIFFMCIEIMMFGKLADIAGSSVLLNDVADTDSLVHTLYKKYPAFANSKFLIAVNKQVVNQNTMLDHKSVVALLPPFSGG